MEAASQCAARLWRHDELLQECGTEAANLDLQLLLLRHLQHDIAPRILSSRPCGGSSAAHCIELAVRLG